jgi:hypothetical protein
MPYQIRRIPGCALSELCVNSLSQSLLSGLRIKLVWEEQFSKNHDLRHLQIMVEWFVRKLPCKRRGAGLLESKTGARQKKKE